MSTHRHPDSDLIDRVGKRLVKERFRLSAQSLVNWRTRGIPVVQRIAFSRLAAENGHVVPGDFLDVFNTLREDAENCSA